MAEPDDNGFVKRGFYLFGAMALLVAVVLGIIFIKPDQPEPIDVKDLPAHASKPGWKIRYNATITLLRRGSAQVPWSIVREMLDEKQQLKNSEFQRPDGRAVADEAQARSFVIATLKALVEWKRRLAEAGMNIDDVKALSEIRADIEPLAKSPIPELQRHALETQRALVK